jgi:hypothetical protein
VIVPVALAGAPSVAPPVTEVMVTSNVSLGSTSKSAPTLMVMVPDDPVTGMTIEDVTG